MTDVGKRLVAVVMLMAAAALVAYLIGDHRVTVVTHYQTVTVTRTVTLPAPTTPPPTSTPG